LLVEFFWEIDVRQIMLKYFTSLFYRFRTIPISILCEPLMKQIGISQFHSTSFNVFDFEFFNVVAMHPRLTAPIAVLLVDTLSKIALSSVFYVQVAMKNLKIVVDRFAAAPEMLEFWKVQLRSMMTTLINLETRFEQHRKIINKEQTSYLANLNLKKRNSSKTPERHTKKFQEESKLSELELLQMKTNEKLIVYQIHGIILTKN